MIPGHVVAGASSPDEVLLSRDRIHSRHRDGRMEAHKWLSDLRARAAEAGQESVDCDGLFDWRAYVSCHPMAIDIIGEGIVKFEGRFLKSKEPHASKLVHHGELAAHRFDFIAHRRDGSAIRMHPGSSKDAALVRGFLYEWCLHATTGDDRASTPGGSYAAIAKAAPLIYEHLNQVDVMGNKDATVRAMELRGPEENVLATWSVDLLHDDKFPWDRWLAARPFGRQLLQEQLTHMSLTWHADDGYFRILVRTQSTPAQRYIIRLSFQTSKLINERAVS